MQQVSIQTQSSEHSGLRGPTADMYIDAVGIQNRAKGRRDARHAFRQFMHPRLAKHDAMRLTQTIYQRRTGLQDQTWGRQEDLT